MILLDRLEQEQDSKRRKYSYGFSSCKIAYQPTAISAAVIHFSSERYPDSLFPTRQQNIFPNIDPVVPFLSVLL